MKRLLPRALLLTILLAATPIVAGVTVPITGDLQADGKLAQQRNVPLLMMFYAEHCYYCTRVEEDFLEPMLISGDYTDKVIIRRVDLENPRRIIDFDGAAVSVSEFAARYQVRVTPTLVYVDSGGRPLTENMVGLTTPDFYGDYIDRRIDTALDQLREKTVRAAATELPGKNLD
ncbi:thioredoxin family protein [Thiohalomonas denitrificans]|uniref:Thioredoxin-related protein n=1 Tax=Thiohalomonas denitrificans TaxID=415747 RepID=A0A1G5QYA2_9GAMM|nr:thioredoxin fold domain-containing protein [Thiohalomonas denitrificans]SCZ66752.1 Thioredoxin-related protein [Thiohalomonas denitrificans]